MAGRGQANLLPEPRNGTPAIKIASLVPLAIALFVVAAPAEELVRLQYNHPGLVVDLGVGLWAWPVPCDADGDGDFDLIVSCPDKPSNGVWLFENATGDTAREQVPGVQAATALEPTVHYVMPSYVGRRAAACSRPASSIPTSPRAGLDARHEAAGARRRFTRRAASARCPRQQDPAQPVALCRLRRRRALDLIVGIEDWSDYGWDDAWDASGQLEERPAARVRLLAAQHRHRRDAAATPQPQRVAGRRQAGRHVRLPVAELRGLRRRRRPRSALRRVPRRLHVLREHRHAAPSRATPPADGCTTPDGAAAGDGLADDRADGLRLGPGRRPRPDRRRRGRPRGAGREHRQARRRSHAAVPAAALLPAGGRRR